MLNASRFVSPSSHGKSGPTRLDFKSGWGVGPVFDWYNSLVCPGAKSIRKIQVRIEVVSGPVPHRFIALYMCDGSIHRFDRRPDHTSNVDGLIFNQAVASEDSYMCGITLKEEEREIELILDGQVDLITVIAVCYAISQDDITRDYTFLRHNCFFFSWTILTIVSRHRLPYEAPLLERFLRRFNSEVDRLTSIVMDEMTALILDVTGDVIIMFLDKVRASAPDGIGLIGRPGSALIPNSLIRFFGRRAFQLHLFFGLRSRLTKLIKAEFTLIAGTIHAASLENNLARELLDKRLWVEGTADAFKEGLKTEVMKILWKSIFKTICGGIGNVEPEHLQDQVTNPELNFTWLGRDVAEYCAVGNAALRAAYLAISQAGQDVEGLSHGDAFDTASRVARDAMFAAAQNAAKIARGVTQKPERDAKWDAIWRVWGDCWNEAHDMARPKLIDAVERTLENILVIGTGVVLQEVKECRTNTIKAHGWRCWGARRGKELNITNAELQEYMRGIIQGNTATTGYLGEVHSSMERVWEKAHLHFQSPAALPEKIAELDPEVAH